MNKNKIIECIKNESLKFEYLDEIYKNDKEIVLVAVKQSGDALKYASDELKSDKEIVLAAIQQNEYALSCASNELKNEIGKNNPVKYLESYLLKQKLNENLINKNNNQAYIKKIKM